MFIFRLEIVEDEHTEFQIPMKLLLHLSDWNWLGALPSYQNVLIQSKLDFSFAFGVVLHKIEACDFVLADFQCLWRYSIAQHYHSVLRFISFKD